MAEKESTCFEINISALIQFGTALPVHSNNLATIGSPTKTKNSQRTRKLAAHDAWLNSSTQMKQTFLCSILLCVWILNFRLCTELILFTGASICFPYNKIYILPIFVISHAQHARFVHLLACTEKRTVSGVNSTVKLIEWTTYFVSFFYRNFFEYEAHKWCWAVSRICAGFLVSNAIRDVEHLLLAELSVYRNGEAIVVNLVKRTQRIGVWSVAFTKLVRDTDTHAMFSQ